MDAKRYSLFWFNEKICINGILFYLDERKRKERKEKGRNEVLWAHIVALRMGTVVEMSYE